MNITHTRFENHFCFHFLVCKVGKFGIRNIHIVNVQAGLSISFFFECVWYYLDYANMLITICFFRRSILQCRIPFRYSTDLFSHNQLKFFRVLFMHGQIRSGFRQTICVRSLRQSVFVAHFVWGQLRRRHS